MPAYKNKSDNLSRTILTRVRRLFQAVVNKIDKNQNLLAASLTPFVFFVYLPVSLYLRNISDLDYRLAVLAPYFITAVIISALGLLLIKNYRRNIMLKVILIAYLCIGPLLFFGLTPSSANRLAVLLIVLIAVTIYVLAKDKIKPVIQIWAYTMPILVVLTFGTLIIGMLPQLSLSKANQIENVSDRNSNKNLPNIYHLILDEYQTEMFDATATKDDKQALGGFVYYPDNTAIYGLTGQSIPSTYLGTLHDTAMTRKQFSIDAFNSEKSFLYDLNKAGYSTQAYLNNIYHFPMKHFDKVVDHKDNVSAKFDDVHYLKLFTKLWIISNSPEPVYTKIINPDFIKQIEGDNLLSESLPVMSNESFSKIIQDREMLGRPNTYTLLHLLVPHAPYVLDENCNYKKDTLTGAVRQTKCANKIMTDFLNELKKIGRYDNSLIIIHSDHGARFKTVDGKLVQLDLIKEENAFNEEWNLARSRALLLVKTPDRISGDPFAVSDAPTTLLDIAPTVLRSLQIESQTEFEGVPLLDENPEITGRDKRPYFYQERNKFGKTDRYFEFTIENNSIRHSSTFEWEH